MCVTLLTSVSQDFPGPQELLVSLWSSGCRSDTIYRNSSSSTSMQRAWLAVLNHRVELGSLPRPTQAGSWAGRKACLPASYAQLCPTRQPNKPGFSGVDFSPGKGLTMWGKTPGVSEGESAMAEEQFMAFFFFSVSAVALALFPVVYKLLPNIDFVPLSL